MGIRIIILSKDWALLGVSALVFGLLCTLGTWQLFRLYEKESYLQLLEKAVMSPPAPLSPTETPGSFAPVLLKGKFIDRSPFFLLAKTYEGKKGYHVVSPFQTTSGSWVLVLRGWTKHVITPDLQEETVLQGQVRLPETKRWYHPDNTQKEWVRIDIEDMSRYLNHSLQPYYVLEESPPSPLKALPLKPNIPNNHLIYLLTWYSLAFALCIMVFIYLRKDSSRDG